MPSIDGQPLPSDGRRATPRNLSAYGCASPRAPRHVPLSCDDRGAWDERDRVLLTRIAYARLRGDERSARLVAGELMTPYLAGVQALIARRTSWMRLQQHDREQIASAVMERLARALLLGKSDFGAPFGAMVAINVDWEVKDFLRARARRLAGETLTPPAEIPDLPTESAPTPIEQTDALRAMLRPLSGREREIAFERFVLDLDAGEIAARRGMNRGAVKMTCSRGLTKLREAMRTGDVTFSDSPSVLRAEGSMAATGNGKPPECSSQKVNQCSSDRGAEVRTSK